MSSISCKLDVKQADISEYPEIIQQLRKWKLVAEIIQEHIQKNKLAVEGRNLEKEIESSIGVNELVKHRLNVIRKKSKDSQHCYSQVYTYHSRQGLEGIMVLSPQLGQIISIDLLLSNPKNFGRVLHKKIEGKKTSVKGVGALLIKRAKEVSLETNARLEVEPQTSSEGFYKKEGFVWRRDCKMEITSEKISSMLSGKQEQAA